MRKAYAIIILKFFWGLIIQLDIHLMNAYPRFKNCNVMFIPLLWQD